LLSRPSTGRFLEDLKDRIRSAQVRAAVAVNSELVLLYWNIGGRIAAAQKTQGWGVKIVPKLSADLRKAFPEMKGFSPRNLDYMLAFARVWTDEPILQQVAAKLPWFHNCVLIDKIKDEIPRHWQARHAVEFGWSRNVLVHQIESKLYERQEKSITNFTRSLPAPKSDLARQIID
jgi:predicted nuclease of restriction endonuclease-like (RecB) superfamily